MIAPPHYCVPFVAGLGSSSMDVELVSDSPQASGPDVAPEDLATALLALTQFKAKPSAVPPLLTQMSLFEAVSALWDQWVERLEQGAWSTIASCLSLDIGRLCGKCGSAALCSRRSRTCPCWLLLGFLL